MKTFKFTLIILIFFSLKTVAQLASTEEVLENQIQYKLEKNNFHISFPAGWEVGTEEKKVLTTWMSVIAAKHPDYPKAGVSIIGNTAMTNFYANKKLWNKTQQQTAKKEKDDFYQVLEEGDFEQENGARYYYKKYRFTMIYQDGSKGKKVRLFYMYMPPGKKMKKLFVNCQFDASPENIDRLEKEYMAIFNSLNNSLLKQ